MTGIKKLTWLCIFLCWHREPYNATFKYLIGHELLSLILKSKAKIRWSIKSNWKCLLPVAFLSLDLGADLIYPWRPMSCYPMNLCHIGTWTKSHEICEENKRATNDMYWCSNPKFVMHGTKTFYPWIE